MRIVCVDDNETMLEVTADILRLERSDCEIQTFVSPKKALAFVSEKGCDVLLTDFSMDAMNGIELITQVKKLDSSIYCILVTGSSPYTLREHYPGDIFDGLIKKPYSYRELLSVIDVGLQVRAQLMAKEAQAKPAPVEVEGAPADTRDSALRDARSFLGRIWDEADAAAPMVDIELGCQSPGHFAARVKEEINRAARYSRSVSLVKIDATGLSGEERGSQGRQEGWSAKMILRMIMPNLRSSDLVTYQHQRVFLLLPETGERGTQSVIGRLTSNIKSKGMRVSLGQNSPGAVVFSSRTYSFSGEQDERAGPGQVKQEA